MTSTRFWKVLFGSGGVISVRVLCSFITNKILALFLGPAMFACVGQFQNIFAIGQATSSLAMQNGWVSLTARYKEKLETLQGVWHAGFRMTVRASIVTVIVAIIFCFAAPLELLFPGIPLRYVQAAILFALPGIVAANVITICQSVMNGLGHYRRWAVISVLTAVFQCVWVVLFLLTGYLSVLSVIATQSLVASVVAIVVARRGGFSLDKLRGKTPLEQKAWLNFCCMGIIPMMLSPIALMLVRSAIGNELGWNAAGIWQSIWRVSDFFSVGFSSVLGVLILPCISVELSKTEFWKVFKPLLLRVFLLAAVIVGLVFLFRHFVILLLFSSEFSAAAELVPTQLIGDFFRAGGWCVGLVLVARQATKIFVIAEVSSQIFFVLFSIFGLSYFGIQAPLMAYAIENICYFFILLFILRKLSWKTL